jgi:serine protease Do
MKTPTIMIRGRFLLWAGVLGVATALSCVKVPHDPEALSFRMARANVLPAATGPASFADIVERVKPAVIGVRTKGPSNQRGRAEPPSAQPLPHRGLQLPAPVPRVDPLLASQGSGFFISADGYAVTNHHVIDGSATAEVMTDDHKSYIAKVVGIDPDSDLALLKIDGRTDFPFVNLADKMPRVGDWVVAIGTPFGLGGTVTAGIVSARERHIGVNSVDDLVQIDAPINKGDSGGPSFDLEGNVVGVNTMIISPTGGSIGIAFAVPAATVKTVLPQLKEKGFVTRGWLGVQIQPVTDDIAQGLGLGHSAGALVVEVQAGGPAAKAGVAAADVIAAIEGEPVKDGQALVRKIGATAPGTAVKLAVIREGAERSITVVVGELPSKRQATSRRQDPPTTSGRASKPSLGLELVPAANVPGAGEQGVVVISIDPEGSAANRGFEPGDIILEVDRKPVQTREEVHAAMKKAGSEGKSNVLMRLKSGNTLRFIAVSPDAG